MVGPAVDRTFIGWILSAKASRLNSLGGLDERALLAFDPNRIAELGLPGYRAVKLPLLVFLADPDGVFRRVDAERYYVQLFPAVTNAPKHVKLNVASAADVMDLVSSVPKELRPHYDILVSEFRTNLFGGIAVTGAGFAVVELAEGVQASMAHGSQQVALLIEVDDERTVLRASPRESELLERALANLSVPPARPSAEIGGVQVGESTYLGGYFEFAILEGFAGGPEELVYLDARSDWALQEQGMDSLRSLLEHAREKVSAVLQGLPGGGGSVEGRATFRGRDGRWSPDIAPDAILVARNSSPEDLDAIVASAGVISVKGGITSHTAVVCRELQRPCVLGLLDVEVDDAGRCLRRGGVTVLSEGQRVVLNATTGTVTPL